MKTHNLTQGTPEWHEFRAAHFPASEAASMLGLSPYDSRNDYLFQRKTGIRKPFPEFVAKKGHETEAGFRPIAEKLMGADLFPATGTSEEHPALSASFDGITLDGKTIWEHKQWSLPLVATMDNGIIPGHYVIQVQQQLLVSGADVCHFFCSDGTSENYREVLIHPDTSIQEQIVAGWLQFEEDLKTFDPALEGNIPSWAREKDPVIDLSRNERFSICEAKLAKVMDDQRLLSDLEKDIRREMIELAGGVNASGEIFKIVVSERKGSISYDKAIKQFGLASQYDWEQFRGKPTTTTTFKRIDA